jgi:hypothetical protein
VSTILTALNKFNVEKQFNDSPLDKVIDENQFSRYFKVFGMSNDTYGLGRHSFVLYGQDKLIRNSEIAIEILDADGQPVVVRAVDTEANRPGWRI